MLYAVCSPRRRASTASGGGHQWWKRDVHHLTNQVDRRTLCGRGNIDWLIVQGDISALKADRNCCATCARIAEGEGL